MFRAWTEVTTKRKVLFALFALLALSWSFFIFSNSFRNASESKEQSSGIVRTFVENVLRVDYEEQSEEFLLGVETFVRKAAHFSEFALFAFLSGVSLCVLSIKFSKIFTSSLISTFAIACTDEFIQLFSDGRACRFTDVLIDVCGGAFALFIIWLTICFRRKNSADKK